MSVPYQRKARKLQRFDRNVTHCPQCLKRGVWDNRAKNEARAQEGKPILPMYECKRKWCGWKSWATSGVLYWAQMEKPLWQGDTGEDDDLRELIDPK